MTVMIRWFVSGASNTQLWRCRCVTVVRRIWTETHRKTPGHQKSTNIIPTKTFEETEACRLNSTQALGDPTIRRLTSNQVSCRDPQLHSI